MSRTKSMVPSPSERRRALGAALSDEWADFLAKAADEVARVAEELWADEKARIEGNYSEKLAKKEAEITDLLTTLAAEKELRSSVETERNRLAALLKQIRSQMDTE